MAEGIEIILREGGAGATPSTGPAAGGAPAGDAHAGTAAKAGGAAAKNSPPPAWTRQADPAADALTKKMLAERQAASQSVAGRFGAAAQQTIGTFGAMAQGSGSLGGLSGFGGVGLGGLAIGGGIAATAGMISAVSPFSGAISGSLAEAEARRVDTRAGIADKYGDKFASLVDSGSRLEAAGTNVAGSLMGGAAAVLGPLLEKIVTPIEMIANTITGIIDFVMPVFELIGDAIGKIVQPFIDFLEWVGFKGGKKRSDTLEDFFEQMNDLSQSQAPGVYEARRAQRQVLSMFGGNPLVAGA